VATLTIRTHSIEWNVNWGELQETALRWSLVRNADAIDAEMLRDYKLLYAHPNFKEVALRGNEFGLCDNTFYLAERMEEIASPTYVPNVKDLMNMRVMTTCVSETVFDYEDLNFRMVDVGGQRNERRKWLHCLSENHEILTEFGFRSMSFVRDNWSAVDIAGYDPQRKTLVFERARGFVYNPPVEIQQQQRRADQQLVRFRNCESGVLLDVTSEHDMWACVGVDGVFAKVHAEKLLNGGCEQVSFCLGASCGLDNSNTSNNDPLLSSLNSTNMEALLRLVGVWICCGCPVSENGDSVFCAPNVVVNQYLRECGLRTLSINNNDDSNNNNNSNTQSSTLIIDARWRQSYLLSNDRRLWIRTLSAAQIRCIVEGASSSSHTCITRSLESRDELISLCLMGG
jgi:hypothetical protein